MKPGSKYEEHLALTEKRQKTLKDIAMDNNIKRKSRRKN